MSLRSILLSRALLLAVGAWGAAASAEAQDAQALQTASLAATCAACHGTNGAAVSGSVVPGLAARPAAELREQMLAYRLGTRAGTVMPQVAKGYSEAQIDRLAAYFSRQRAP